MSFIEERLLDRVAFGFAVIPTAVNTRVHLHSGKVAVNSEISTPLFMYVAPYDKIDPSNFSTVMAAFIATAFNGAAGFRFKDRSNYSVTGETIGTAVGGAGETMQLILTYSLGSTETERTIKKPVTGTVQLYEDGAPLASSVDTTTGIVTFTSSAGKVITADFEFDVPVMFEDDDMQFIIEQWEAHTGSFRLREDFRA